MSLLYIQTAFSADVKSPLTQHANNRARSPLIRVFVNCRITILPPGYQIFRHDNTLECDPVETSLLGEAVRWKSHLS